MLFRRMAWSAGVRERCMCDAEQLEGSAVQVALGPTSHLARLEGQENHLSLLASCQATQDEPSRSFLRQLCASPQSVATVLQPVSLRGSKENKASRDTARAVWGLLHVEKERGLGQAPGSPAASALVQGSAWQEGKEEDARSAPALSQDGRTVWQRLAPFGCAPKYRL